jgi:hypothetical protein
MAFDNGYTAVTGGTLSAAQWNTHVRDNFSAVFPYTTAGDIAYATSSSALTRLAAPAADALMSYDLSATAPAWLSVAGNAHKFLAVNSAGTEFEFAGSGIKVYSLFSDVDYTHSTVGTWRDVPNASSSDVVVDVTSTVMAFGNNSTAGIGTYAWRRFAFSIDGTNLDNTFYSDERYAIGEVTSTVVGGIKTGVTAGTITVKMREFLELGTSYTSLNKWFIVLVIPE